MGPIIRISTKPVLAVLLGALSMSSWVSQPIIAADSLILEREQLVTLARQLDLIDRLAEHAANTAPQELGHYHFDYTRLRSDLKRIRAGVQDYLVPQRAQPRDPGTLLIDYVRRDAKDDEDRTR
jgi:RAQPRD family integrative conjugative element protein